MLGLIGANLGRAARGAPTGRTGLGCDIGTGLAVMAGAGSLGCEADGWLGLNTVA